MAKMEGHPPTVVVTEGEEEKVQADSQESDAEE